MNKKQIIQGYVGVGRRCTVLGDAIESGGRKWLPVQFDDEEDPTFFKPEGLGEIKETTTIKIQATLELIDKIKMEPIDFPCICVSTSDYHPGRPDLKYRWEHAGVVDSVIRGAADYFKIKEIHPL